jgi:uncharacterized lipoprotein YbaY
VKKTNFAKISLIAGFIAIAATAVGCANHKKPDPMNSVSGTLSTHVPVKLSPDAVAYVRLADVTDGAVNSKTVVQQEIHSPDGSLPTSFDLVYNEKRINPNRDYAVDVRIVDRGELLLMSGHEQPVITNGNANSVAMTLERPGRH